MNEPNQDQERIERLLKAARPAEPSASLKERVTAAAQGAWEQTPVEIPWRVPIWRLAVSAAAAAIIISFGNHLGNFARSRVRPASPATASVPDSELEELAETIYGPARSRLGMSRYGGRGANEAGLRDKAESIQQMLEELDSNGVPVQPTPGGGRSRLLRDRPHGDTYS